MYIVYYSKKKISSLNTSLIINIFKGELNAYALGLVNSDFFFLLSSLFESFFLYNLFTYYILFLVSNSIPKIKGIKTIVFFLYTND